ncbi:MAG: aminotransferase class III-fold pyridoxal phosphate-dependent enzyme, partial [Actinomycetota bacterium]|nr:aminotransferase class III-fold pyridoxal phosphate-dependent enzyme [Actinomycetota bacterium]
TRLDSPVEPETVALGVEVVAQEGTRVAAPVAGVVSRQGDSTVRLVHDTGLCLLVEGVDLAVADGEQVAVGALIGVLTGATASLRWCVSPHLDPPAFAPPSTAAGWLTLCPDPSPLLGVDVAAARPDPADLLRRRRSALASVQESYYDRPMRIERGWRHHLVDIEGRAYVDMVNNVAAIGHGHPRLADAVEQQLRTLNTNSRFHYAAIAQFSERLAALAPRGLDQVFLVNSGSEAVDLALRMAQTVTGRQDVVAVREAYHGWTALSDAVTTSLYDNPSALESRPEWVHLASAPNAYRGRFRGPTAGADYVTELRELVEGLAAEGRPPAAYVCEPLLGNAGGVLLPDGYLAAAYEAVRAVGGLAVADEVQVGYGRTGRWWWAFERSGVVPDVITIAKAMGNGHPLGAVITTREIASAFEAAGSFFSSAGGSPVSCVTGMTVLDVIEDEGLQANAVMVGDHLLQGCAALKARHPIIGAVHGTGLYLGVELVRDRESLEPASAECAAICERLRRLGVIVQPTGERANVLKLKPPMCLTVDSADMVLRALGSVLTDGW